ncbi:hypothetical protein GW658_21470 [Escherichia coli]|uniref:hypothetical protein n=1 Tax=Escherichia coli TaxID=562 RepID=UPI0016509626|nr:hypothetical protein [Escherichia coli]MBC6577759.1 hypothetical protein [Escherichia coli]
MLFFWCVFFSLIVSILNISQSYNERIYIDEQDRIIKENIYVDYLTVNADVLSDLCAADASKCKETTSTLSEELSGALKEKLSDYDNSITPEICIYEGEIIVYTSHYFNINRYKDSSLFNLSDVPNNVKVACSINDDSGIAVIKTFNKQE